VLTSMVFVEIIAKPPVNARMASQSAPARTRMPATQNGGTITRRTNAPVRRPQAGIGITAAIQEPKSAPIVVSGVGGLRALRGARANK
jgi:hypothetical protein